MVFVRICLFLFITWPWIVHALNAPTVMVPPGLQPGNVFYIIFITSGKLNATATDANTYNTFVNSQADLVSSKGTDDPSITWTAIVATQNGDNQCSSWYANTSISVFNINGDVIATSKADLFDGSIENTASYNQSGANALPSAPWVGCASDGTPKANTLGTANPNAGNADKTNGAWLDAGSDSQNVTRAIYAVSPVLTVPPDSLGRAYLMTTSNSVNQTTLHIINSSETDQDFTGTLYDGSGSQLGSKDTPLHTGMIRSNGRLTLNASDLETLFFSPPWNGPAILEVKGSSSFDLLAKLTSPSGLVSNTNCVRSDRVHSVLGAESSDRTYIRFINEGTTTLLNIRGTLYDEGGNIIGPPKVTLLDQLGPKQSVWLKPDELVSLVGEDWTGDATLIISGTITDLKLLDLNFVNSDTFFNFSCFESSESKMVYLMTTSASINATDLHIVNTSSSPQQFVGTLYNGDGVQLGSASQPLHDDFIMPNERIVLSSPDIESLFLVAPWNGPAILEINGTPSDFFASASFELMTKLRSPSGLISNTNCARENNVQNIEGMDSANISFIRFINKGTKTISNIKGSLYDADGNVIGQSNITLLSQLNAKESVWLDRDELASLVGEEWIGEAMLAITGSDPNLRLLNLNLVNGETFFNFSCYESGI